MNKKDEKPALSDENSHLRQGGRVTMEANLWAESAEYTWVRFGGCLYLDDGECVYSSCRRRNVGWEMRELKRMQPSRQRTKCTGSWETNQLSTYLAMRASDGVFALTLPPISSLLFVLAATLRQQRSLMKGIMIQWSLYTPPYSYSLYFQRSRVVDKRGTKLNLPEDLALFWVGLISYLFHAPQYNKVRFPIHSRTKSQIHGTFFTVTAVLCWRHIIDTVSPNFHLKLGSVRKYKSKSATGQGLDSEFPK